MGDLGDVVYKPRNGHGLVLFPLPLQGHINSMLQLANILYSQGFSITVIHTEFNSPSLSKFPHFTFRSIPDGLSGEGHSSISDMGILTLLSALNVNCVEPFRMCLAETLQSNSDASKDRIACLISDSVWHFSQRIADELNIRRMELRTTSISSFSGFSALLSLHKRGYFPLQDMKLEEPPMELWPLRLKDLPILETENPEELYRLLESMVKELKGCSGLISNSFEELEPAKLNESGGMEVPVPVFSIGPFHKYFPASSSSLLKQDKSSLLWLDKQAPNSVLYVSFGSLASIDAAQFEEIASGLLESEQPFLWVVRPGLVHGLDLLPGRFMGAVSGRGLIVQWAPQQEVLAHPSVGGFWSHCGWNSTLESICEGVPMICMPCFGDQRVNARFISHIWRIGLQLEGKAQRGDIRNAIRRLMMSEEGEEIRGRMRNLKAKVDYCVKPEGSSYDALQSLTTHLLSF
ncbi:UDP-glycosyltransferase 76B1-like [Punica granatum]|uniref:Uncharacterized protein n=2 Tax=Punica granatum TaxID=22663 RepID=A0A218XQK0_PUNGR|nr:UDP-glycosyltransferase 76B1-like [Punica granatum]OWM87455.1 hypothetical protein CDL15_Pgr022566 [Punica granatum]PKI46622.1 hypothetical protein CRG98_032964 [Punica granatum]